MPTAAQNLRHTFDEAGAVRLRDIVENPTVIHLEDIVPLAKSVLAIEQHLVEQAGRRKLFGT